MIPLWKPLTSSGVAGRTRQFICVELVFYSISFNNSSQVPFPIICCFFVDIGRFTTSCSEVNIVPMPKHLQPTIAGRKFFNLQTWCNFCCLCLQHRTCPYRVHCIETLYYCTVTNNIMTCSIWLAWSTTMVTIGRYKQYPSSISCGKHRQVSNM